MTVDQPIIGDYRGSNSPFVLALHLIRKSDVVIVLDPVRHKQPSSVHPVLPVGGLRLKTGARVTKMKFPPQTCIMEMTTNRSDAGVVYIFLIEFPMPASRADVDAWLFENREGQFVALAESPNGTVWVVGNEERGLRTSMIQTVGAVNQHFLTVSGALNLPTFVLAPAGIGTDLLAIFPDTDFNTDFSLDFNS